MALEFIVKTKIDGKKIALPRQSFNGEVLKYLIDSETREISFFYANNGAGNVFSLNTWDAPKGARKVNFSFYKKHGQDIMEAPRFYDSEGNLLKIGNR